MTNLEAIRSDLKPFPVEDSVIIRRCVKHGLVAEATITSEPTITQIVIEILSQMVSLGGVGEGGVSFNFNKEAVENQINRLCRQIGLDSSNYIKEATIKRLE